MRICAIPHEPIVAEAHIIGDDQDDVGRRRLICHGKAHAAPHCPSNAIAITNELASASISEKLMLHEDAAWRFESR